MMQSHRQLLAVRARRTNSYLWLGAGLLIGAMLLSPLAVAQPVGQSATLERQKVVSEQTHQFPLTTSSSKKVIAVPTQPEGRTVSGEIQCAMQTEAEMHNWYPFRYYLYKKVNGQLSVIKGGGINPNKHTYAYTVTQGDENSNASYVFSAHLNHAQVTGQCTLVIKVTEMVQMNRAPRPAMPLTAPDSPRLQRIPPSR